MILRLWHRLAGCPDLPHEPEADGSIWKCRCGALWEGQVTIFWWLSSEKIWVRVK